MILLDLITVGFSGRDDSNDVTAFSITMTYNQHSDGGAQPQEHEAVFFVGMLWVRDHAGVFIQKGSFCLRK